MKPTDNPPYSPFKKGGYYDLIKEREQRYNETNKGFILIPPLKKGDKGGFHKENKKYFKKD